MSPLALWLCVILLIGSVTAADVPFVFDDTSSGVAGYTANQFEKISTSSSDLAGIPQATTPSNDEILEFPVTGGGSTPGEKTETKVEELNRTINSKVDPDDDTVYRVAHQLAAEHPGDFTIDQVDEIYSYLKYGNDSMRAWSYSRDTRGVDKFNSASESLSLGHQAKSKCVGSGDCDDFAILIASLVESVGGTTRVIFARNNSTGGHAYAEVYLGRLNDLNSYVEEIINWLKQNYDTDKIFTHIDTDTKDVWLNLDWGPDDKGNMHPGGPFFQGDKHYIICIRNKFAKTPMNVPEKDNKPPKLISLTPNKNSPQNFGVIITWNAEAKDPEKDPIQYRFFRNDEPETKWQEENIWTWTTTDYDIGENQIAVRVRDGKHASPNGFDGSEVANFDITKLKPRVPENRPTIIDSLVPDKLTPQETGSKAPVASFVPAPLAEVHAESWQKTFGGSDLDRANSVQQTNDGGYIIAGSTDSGAWLIKTDPAGDKLWDRTFGGSDLDRANSVQQTNDGGYIIAGEIRSYGAGYFDAWLIKTDPAGNKLWDRTFGGSDLDRANSVQQTNDGGYIITGSTDSGAWLIKTDPAGNKLWDRTFGESDDVAWSVQQTNDGGYIIAGSAAAGAWLIKTDSAGNKLWDRTLNTFITFSDSYTDIAGSVQQTSDSGYIIAGRTTTRYTGSGSICPSAWLIKTDSAGNKLWDRTFGKSECYYAMSVQQTSDSGYIIAGSAAPGGAWLIKTDPAGNKLWDRTFGKSEFNSADSVQQTNDGGYIIAGTIIAGSEDTDVSLIKTDANGN